jgi:L-alanine-DL-glutamate epimerase-like enolase superfamily enzyme
VAEAANKPVVIGTEWGCCGIVAAKLHLGSALAHTNPVVEFTEIMIHDLLMKEPLKLVDGYLQVPSAPGLGFEPDPEKLERYRTPK